MATRSQRRRRRAIHAAAHNEIIAFYCDVAIQAADDAATPPTFSVTAYNGGPLTVKGYPLPVVVDLAGLTLANSVLANLDHDQKQRVGHVTAHTNDGKSLTFAGVVSGTSGAAGEVIANHKNGYPWQASIEAQPQGPVEEIKKGKSVTVNGQVIPGPVFVARKAKLYGFAFLSRGADETTTVAIAATRTTPETRTMKPELKAFIEAAGFDADEIDESQLAFLTKQHEADVKAAATTTPSTLDDVVAAQKAENDRQQQITYICSREIQAAPQNLEAIQTLGRLAIEGKKDVATFELEVLRASRPQGSFAIHSSRPEVNSDVIEAAICRAGGLHDIEKSFNERTLEAAHRQFPNGIGLKQAFILAAESNGYRSNGGEVTVDTQRAAFRMQQPGQIQAAGWSNIELAGILSNTANKFLTNGFNAVERAYSLISSTKSVRDFKTISSYGLTAAATYEKVPPSGEIKHGTLGETPYLNRAETYGKMLALTRVDITNDDLGALTEVPMKLGRGGALALNGVFWTEFMDSLTFWDAGNGGRITGGTTNLGLDGVGLTEGEVAFANQTDPDGDPLGSAPAILLTGPSLRNNAAQLMRSNQVVGTTGQPDLNVFSGRYTPVTSVYLENTNFPNASLTAWWLLASPSDISVIEIVYLNGQQTPIVETADANFNSLGVQMRAYFDFGVRKQEYRGGIASDGA